MKLIDKDRKYLGRDGAAQPVEIVGADGNYLIGKNGKRYIDFLMGWCVGNIGWNKPIVEKRLRQFHGPDYVNPSYLYRPWGDLAELLAEITPSRLVKSFRATGGTEAVEIALQAAMKYTGRSEFVSIEGGYHGHSIGAMSIGMSEFRDWYSNLLPNCHKISPPLDSKAALIIASILRHRKIAALVMEPIICNLGVVVPDQKFFRIVQKACKQYQTLLIIDEVATGFGRTGKMFASEHYAIKPDIMCLAKGITGGYGGLGVAIMTQEVAKAMDFNFSFYSTFGWHPINVEAALANIQYLQQHWGVIQRNIKSMSHYFELRLSAMKFKTPAVIRVKGLAIGIEFREDKYAYASEIVARCRKHGLLFSDLGSSIITLFPALDISKNIAQTGLDIIEKCL